MKFIRTYAKNFFRKHNIQFRKIDPRRSENIVLGINQDYTRQQKKILISYLDYNRSAYALRHTNPHTNLQELMQLIKVLINLDFSIDICACDNEDAAIEMPSDYYDYIFGFGKMFRLAKQQNPKAYAILYMTENPYSVSLINEQARIDYFYERTGRHTQLSRTGKFYLENDELLADSIICLGERKYFEHASVFRIYPSAFRNNNYKNNITDKRINTNFLVFGVKGFIHKGNDLLIEIFKKHPEWTLYMCGTEIENECKKLKLSLPKNIINCGFVDVKSNKFINLIEKCPFVLLPSCSEGMSTSLMTCMRHGLIPVTMPGTGMDELSEYCEYFNDYHISSIEEKLNELTHMDKDQQIQYSNKIFQYANENFSIEKYTTNMNACLSSIFSKHS